MNAEQFKEFKQKAAVDLTIRNLIRISRKTRSSALKSTIVTPNNFLQTELTSLCHGGSPKSLPALPAPSWGRRKGQTSKKVFYMQIAFYTLMPQCQKQQRQPLADSFFPRPRRRGRLDSTDQANQNVPNDPTLMPPVFRDSDGWKWTAKKAAAKNTHGSSGEPGSCSTLIPVPSSSKWDVEWLAVDMMKRGWRPRKGSKRIPICYLSYENGWYNLAKYANVIEIQKTAVTPQLPNHQC